MTSPSARGESPRRRRALLDNWAYKLAAFFLVTLLWINVTADERQPAAIRTLLEVDVQDSAWVLVESPEAVRTTFQGRNRELLSLLTQPPVIRQIIDTVTSPTMRVSLSADQVAYDRSLSVRPSAVEPASVEFRFERRTDKRVPVLPSVEATAAMGFTLVRPFPVEPESVWVRGAASAVDGIRALATRRISLEDLGHTVMMEVPLLLPLGAGPVDAVPASVLVTVPVDSLVERRLTLPTRVEGSAAGSVALGSDSVEVILRGAWSAVRSQMARLSVAVVRVDAVPAQPTRVPVQLNIDPSSAVSPIIRPAEVSVRPR